MTDESLVNNDRFLRLKVGDRIVFLKSYLPHFDKGTECDVVEVHGDEELFSVSGCKFCDRWCSWFAYKSDFALAQPKITEEELKHAEEIPGYDKLREFLGL